MSTTNASASDTSPATRYANFSAVNKGLAARGLRVLTTSDDVAAFRSRITNVDHLYAALDTPISNSAATDWLSVHLSPVSGSAREDGNPFQLTAPSAMKSHARQAISITPQEGRSAPYVHRSLVGGNPAADASRNPANTGGQLGGAHVRRIDDARATRVSGERAFDQHTVFGRACAVQFECGRYSTVNPLLTVNLKAAAAKDGADCKNGVNWEAAINLRLSPCEIALFLAVLLGQSERFRAAGHGMANDKWFQIEPTTDKYAGALRLGINQARRHLTVNITHVDLLQVIGVFERAAMSCLQTREIATEAKTRRLAQLYAIALTR